MKKCTGLAFASLVLAAFALTGCGSDTGVTGVEGIDVLTGGSDVLLTDFATDQDGYVALDGNPYTDVWTGYDGTTDSDGYIGYDASQDIWIGYDTGPIGCTADVNCPFSPCAKGVCDQSTHQCVFYTAPNGTPCGPSPGPTSCVGQGFCQNGQCTAAGLSCDDGDPCTNDYCDQSGTCLHLAMPGCNNCKGDFMCDDGNPCTTDACIAQTGICQHIPVPNCGAVGCQTAAMCNDFNNCTVDTCVFGPSGIGSCVHYADPKQPSTCCDPTSNAITCNDGNPCTSDYCAPNFQCMYQTIPGCVASVCKTDAQCDDGIKCSIDKCQFDALTGAGTCTHYGDLTQKGFCCDPNMNSIACNDGNNCTFDQCGSDFQCSYLPIPGCGVTGCKSSLDCNDGNACTQDMCFGGQCSYSGIGCASSDPCTTAACDPKSGQCMYTPIPGCGTSGCMVDAQCDDFNSCTIDACALSSSGKGTCVHKVDLTQAGYCCDPTSSAPSTCNDGNSCTQDLCGPNYQCQFMPIPGCTAKCKLDSDCAGGDVCTLAKCDVPSGVCLYGTIPNCCNPLYCDDGNPCTKDGCDASTGGCTNTPIPGCVKPCDPTMCNDNNPCTTDLCDPLGNCQNLPIPNCTIQYCKSDIECQDADPCTKDYCDYTTYTCQHISPPGCGVTACKSNAECNDFNACTGDLCLNNQCAHKAVTCDDGNPCTADQCLAATGGCSNVPIPGCIATQCKTTADCTDNNPCTLDTCVSGYCNFTPIPGCFLPP